MGNNGWLLLRIIMLFLHCYCIIITDYYIAIMSWFLRIISHYCILLHIIAYCCFFQIHVTVILSWQDQGPAHQKLMETPDDDVSEPYPKTWSPPWQTPSRPGDDSRQVIDHHGGMCTKGSSPPAQSWNRWTWELFWPSVPITQKTAESIEDIRGHHDYAATGSGAQQGPGSWGCQWIWRVLCLKREADCISRSHYEVYLFQFATKHILSEAAVDELLEMLIAQ